ncbi:MAG: M20 family metallopeptidase [Acidobacteriota bacterium]
MRLTHAVMDRDFLELCSRAEASLLELLDRLVNLPSPSGDKQLVDAVSRLVAAGLRQNQIPATVIPKESVGDIVWGEWRPERAAEGRILVLCHLDTVWPADASGRNPFRVDGERIYGPGVFDMKAGVALTLKVQEFLSGGVIRPCRTVRFLYTTDEEIGSYESRQIIEEFAGQSDIVLVTEPPLPGGGLKTFRKGSGMYRVDVTGRASHAGLEPEKGINAIEELALQIAEIKGLEDRAKGTTLTFTLIEGGTACNVVPDHASASIDVRFREETEGKRVDQGLRRRHARTRGARTEVLGSIDRPVMAPTARTREVSASARNIARELGLDLWEGEAGGGSDGNFTAALGVPTLDGLGVEGEGAHTWDEHVLRRSVVPRLALLARLIERL